MEDVSRVNKYPIVINGAEISRKGRTRKNNPIESGQRTTEIQTVQWMADVLMKLQGVKEGICPHGGGNSHIMDLRTFWKSNLSLQDFLANCE